VPLLPLYAFMAFTATVDRFFPSLGCGTNAACLVLQQVSEFCYSELFQLFLVIGQNDFLLLPSHLTLHNHPLLLYDALQFLHSLVDIENYS
jgi:hypothetical protein